MSYTYQPLAKDHHDRGFADHYLEQLFRLPFYSYKIVASHFCINKLNKDENSSRAHIGTPRSAYLSNSRQSSAYAVDQNLL